MNHQTSSLPSTEKIRYVGLDLHKAQITYCIIDADGKVLARGKIPTTRQAILAFSTKVLQVHDRVALEATLNTWAVVDLIEPHVQRVVVSNPLTTKAIATAKIKTDAIDAHTLAQLLRCDYLPCLWQPDRDTRRLRSLVNQRAGLVSDATSFKNRIHAHLTQQLVEVEPTQLFNDKGTAWLQSVQLPADTRMAVDRDLRLLERVNKELNTMDELLAGLGYKSEEVRLLTTLSSASANGSGRSRREPMQMLDGFLNMLRGHDARGTLDGALHGRLCDEVDTPRDAGGSPDEQLGGGIFEGAGMDADLLEAGGHVIFALVGIHGVEFDLEAHALEKRVVDAHLEAGQQMRIADEHQAEEIASIESGTGEQAQFFQGLGVEVLGFVDQDHREDRG
jgi:hypothetical protein